MKAVGQGPPRTCSKSEGPETELKSKVTHLFEGIKRVAECRISEHRGAAWPVESVILATRCPCIDPLHTV